MKLNINYSNMQLRKDVSRNLALEKVRSRGFIVGSINDEGAFSISTNPVVHQTADEAAAEARRLATTYPGKTFFYVRLHGAFVAQGVQEI